MQRIAFALKYFLTMICPPLVLSIGLVGNLLVILVFSRRNMRRNKSNHYLRSLAVSDALASASVLIYFGQFMGIEPLYLSATHCKALDALGYFVCANSNFILGMVSIDRLALIKYKQFVFIHKPAFKLGFVAALYTTNLTIYGLLRAMNVNLMTFVEDNTTFFSCDIDNESFKTSYALFDIIYSTLLPGLLMLFCSVSLIRVVYLSRKRLFQASGNDKKCFKSVRQDVQFAVITIVMNVCFLVFNLPCTLYNLFGDEGDLVFMLTNMLFYFQYAFNIFVYMCLNKVFKRELLLIISPGRVSRNKIHTMSTHQMNTK